MYHYREVRTIKSGDFGEYSNTKEAGNINGLENCKKMVNAYCEIRKQLLLMTTGGGAKNTHDRKYMECKSFTDIM